MTLLETTIPVTEYSKIFKELKRNGLYEKLFNQALASGGAGDVAITTAISQIYNGTHKIIDGKLVEVAKPNPILNQKSAVFNKGKNFIMKHKVPVAVAGVAGLGAAGIYAWNKKRQQKTR